MILSEEWRDIEGFEGYYQVSSFGRIRSVDRFVYNKGNSGENKYSFYKGKVMRQGRRKKGYLGITLSKGNKNKSFLVHRLVANAFIPNPYNLSQINHKDENPANNHVDNLEWCSPKYNINYGNCIDNMIKTRTNNAYNQKPVICLESGIIYSNSNDAQRNTGICARNIRANCEGKYKSAGKLHWKWA